jgi:hypothetical protein
MKIIPALMATLVVASSPPARSQSHPTTAVAPADRSTGPTVPSTRSVEMSTAVPPGSGSKSDRPAAGSIDNDPPEPTGVPGQSSGLGANQTR